MAIPLGLIPQIQQQAQVQLWQGQFPPPDAVQKYEEILPGSFNRMIRMAESLQEAQINDAKRAQDYTSADTKRGQWLGFSAVLASVLGAAACTIAAAITHQSGGYWVAGALVGVPVMAVAKALVESARTPSAKDIIQAAAPKSAPPTAQPPPAPQSRSLADKPPSPAPAAPP